MITTQACYSRVDAIIGAQTVSEIPAGTVLRVVAVTDTGYYKLENGSFVHSDYLADSNATPTPTTTAAPVQTTPAPSDPTTPSANNVTGNVKYTKRYFWSQLTASEQTLYADIVKAAENFETGYIAAPAGMSTDDKKKIYFLVFNMEPQLFWIDTSVTTTGDSVRLSYTLTPNQAASMKTEIDATAAKVIKQANQYSSTFNKLLVFYNYIILNNDFLLESTSATCGIENGLRPGTSGIQCNGYAKTMQYLCDIAGIECLTIPGMNNNTPSSTHAWNKIKIGSSWYNMDATWGDPEDKGGKYISHPFFLVPDAWITNSHLASNTKTLNNGTTLYFFNAPACTATDMNYFKIMNREYTDLDTAFNAMAAELKRALEAGEMTAEIRVTDNAVYNTLLTDEYTLALRKYARQFVPGLEVKRQRANREKSQIYQLDLIY
jgi:HAMP domain-containing protein